MTEMVDALLVHVRPALLRVLIAALFALSGSGLYLYGFKGAFAQRGQLRETVASLGDKPDPTRVQAALDSVRGEAAVHAQRLAEIAPTQDIGRMNTSLMAALQASASEHHVRLLRVTPGVVSAAQGFAAVPFEVDASGGYESLYGWLREVERRFDAMPIGVLHVEAGSGSETRVLRMTLVSHRLADDKPT